MSRIQSFDQATLTSLESYCKLLFKLSIIVDLCNPTPSFWVLCKAVPYHAKLTLKQYGLGLGVNCMEGREQKHQRIKKCGRTFTHPK